MTTYWKLDLMLEVRTKHHRIMTRMRRLQYNNGPIANDWTWDNMMIRQGFIDSCLRPRSQPNNVNKVRKTVLWGPNSQMIDILCEYSNPYWHLETCISLGLSGLGLRWYHGTLQSSSNFRCLGWTEDANCSNFWGVLYARHSEFERAANVNPHYFLGCIVKS